MIFLKLNWLFTLRVEWIAAFWIYMYTLRSTVWVVLNNFLFIDATDRSKISSDHDR